MTPESLAAFVDEMQKLSEMPAPAAKEEDRGGVVSRARSSLKRHAGVGTLAMGGLTAALAAKNPQAAGKFFRHAKELVTKPGKSLARGWKSGRTDITSGAGASDAASKRVGMYKDTFRSAGDGRLLQHDVLTQKDPGFLRRQNILGVGERSKEGLKLNKALAQRVKETQGRLDAGERIPESQLRALYDEIGQAGSAQKLKPAAGLTTYMPGERSANVGLGTVGGVAGGLESHDPETGRKRGVGERLARGAAGAGTAIGLGHMFMGRGTGMDAGNFIPKSLRAKLPKTFRGNQIPLTGDRSMLSQKGLLPLAAGGVLAAGEGVAADAAGAGGQLVDRAFGQGE
jgi:hypothetical protein